MPVTSRSQKAEAKYNVTTEFPHLGLHSAAATGNIGLVKYALSHGQPINSVIDGVLPLHAACSGGNDLVVRLLIENGADVNAPRLPRRYSTNPRTTSAPIVGTSGSAPLHFAAANGHTSVVRTLLLHGARPARADKHGVTPEMLARANGWIACADAIAQWVADKDRDLRERETLIFGVIPPDEPDTASTGQSGEQQPECSHGAIECAMCGVRRRLGMKRSVDNALHLFRPTSSSSPASSSPAPDSPLLAETPPPLMELPPRRPSLPHTPLGSSGTPSTPNARVRRPSSAGTGASVPRKLGSKYSLLHLFKKQSSEDLEGGEFVRPGILRAHARSSSSGAGGVRFDKDGEGSPRVTVGSPSPERDEKDEALQDEDEDGFDEDDVDDDEEEYGQPIQTCLVPRRPRGQSGSSQASLPSPLSKGASAPGVEFPFSIERPPQEDAESDNLDGRVRGDSQSTTFSVRTPAPAPTYLPQPRVVPPDSPPTPSFAIDREITEGEKEKVKDKDRTPCVALNVREISSHAQAEALVAETQRAVLELAAEREADAHMPLSARLAAYGESLRLERKFKMREQGEADFDEAACDREIVMERRASEGLGSAEDSSEWDGEVERPYGVKARSASATMDRDLSALTMNGRRRGLDRNLSFEHRGTARRGRSRRPHTAGGDPKSDDGFLPSPGSLDVRSGQIRSRSAAPPRIDSDLANLHEYPKPVFHAHTATATLSHTATPPRSRTPDPDVPPGVPLSRVLTAPPQDTLNDLGVGARRDHPRHVVRANKLARMGFAPEKTDKSPAQSVHRHPRLGGLKSFVQSLKGKS